MKKFLSWLIVWLLMMWGVFAARRSTNYSTYDMLMNRFLFTSWGTASGAYVLDTNSWWTIIAYGPLLDGSGNAFITGWAVSGVYLKITNSGDYFNLNSWTYFNANSWVYFETNSGTYFLANSGVYFETNSWTYFNLYSWDYFNANSGTYFNLNSGTYYTTNPLWYITGWQVPASLRQTSTVWWLTEWLSPVSTWYVGLLVGHWVSAANANIWATVIWTNSSADGDYALALWLTNTADASNAVSIGNNITNSTQYKVVLWKHNVDYTSGAFEFWYWTAWWDLNLLTIFQDWSTRLTAKDQAGNSYLTGLALSGYLTWYTESDPVRLAASGNYCALSWGAYYGPAYDASGNAYSTGAWGLTGDYLPLAGNTTGTAISGEIHIASSENIFFDTNDWVYSYIWLGWWWGNSIDLIKDSETWDKSYVGINDLYVPHLSYWAIWMPATQVFLDSSWLQYYDDYSGSYTDRSLIDKWYADATYTNGANYLLLANSGDYYTSNPLGYITGWELTGVTSDWSTGWLLCLFSWDGSIYGNSSYYMTDQYWLIHYAAKQTWAAAYFYNYYAWTSNYNAYAITTFVKNATAEWIERQTFALWTDLVAPLVKIMNSTTSANSGGFADNSVVLDVRQSAFGWGNIIQALKNGVAKFRVDGIWDTYLSGNFYPQRIVKRVSVVWSASTLTPAGEQDIYQLTGLATGLTLVNSTSIYDGEQFKLRIKDNGTGQTLTWGTGYVAKGGIALPTLTTTGKVMVFGFEWFANLGAWNLLALSVEA
jgi:hypothetical protein